MKILFTFDAYHLLNFQGASILGSYYHKHDKIYQIYKPQDVKKIPVTDIS